MDLEVRLAELLCTRLCHDLTGPIGAVNNGAEFLGEEGFTMQQQAMELIIGSAQQAVARLQFYRHAYGRVNSQGEACLDEVRELAVGFFHDTRTKLDWPRQYTNAAGVSISRKMARLMVNMMILVSGSMPKGGVLQVRIGKRDNGPTEVSIRGEGESIRIDEESMQALQGKMDTADLTPKTVQPYLTGLLAKQVSVVLSRETGACHFEMKAVHP